MNGERASLGRGFPRPHGKLHGRAPPTWEIGLSHEGFVLDEVRDKLGPP